MKNKNATTTKMFQVRYWNTLNDKDAGIFNGNLVDEKQADFWIENYGTVGGVLKLYKKPKLITPAQLVTVGCKKTVKSPRPIPFSDPLKNSKDIESITATKKASSSDSIISKAIAAADARKPTKAVVKPKLCYVCKRKPADPYCHGACNSPRCILTSMRDHC